MLEGNPGLRADAAASGHLQQPRRAASLLCEEVPDDGWRIPRMPEALHDAPDLFCDVVSQVHLPSWSKGHVALVGDAAYVPWFWLGQGSSIALVGAYVLAGELGTRSDHREAFAAYECGVREFVRRNQALADDGAPLITPQSGAA
jgi:2-polyprenyl-6-methoxyphenol hydroxylase-like FAD-dependent oxidoreductase